MQPTEVSSALVRPALPSLSEAPAIEATASNNRPAEQLPEPPIVGYEQSNGRPFIVDMLDLSPVYGQSGFEKHLGNIDAYVLNQITERGYEPNKDSYRSIVSELLNSLGIAPELAYTKKLTKLNAYIGILQREAKIRSQRRALEHYVTE